MRLEIIKNHSKTSPTKKHKCIPITSIIEQWENPHHAPVYVNFCISYLLIHTDQRVCVVCAVYAFGWLILADTIIGAGVLLVSAYSMQFVDPTLPQYRNCVRGFFRCFCLFATYLVRLNRTICAKRQSSHIYFLYVSRVSSGVQFLFI